jgi:penicillin G amidase
MRAVLAISRAQNWEQFRAALQDWALPVYNWGYADVDGHVGYQCAARIPLRGRVVRGYREANNPLDRWNGAIPFSALPSQYDPARSFIASANQTPVDHAYPYPIYGAFASGVRALRIRETLTGASDFDGGACAVLQNDTLSPRARRLVPHLLRRFAAADDPAVRTFCDQLAGWDYRYDLDATAPVFFELFLQRWKRRVVAERFPEHLLFAVTDPGSVTTRLIETDDLAWFRSDKAAALLECTRQVVAAVRAYFGADPSGWTWGAVHRVFFRHPLSTEASADIFDVGPRGVAGAADTVRNTGAGGVPPVAADSGAEYRLVADLSAPAGILATQCLGQSGQPGSPHYADQFSDWVAGDYHLLRFDRPDSDEAQGQHLRLTRPEAASST